MWQREEMAANFQDEADRPETAGDVLLVDARTAVLVAQLAGADGRPYLTSRSVRGNNVHEPLDDSTERSSYRVTDLLTVDVDRTSAFVAGALEDGSFLVLALNEGVVVTPNHFGTRRVPLAPHHAFIAGPDDQVGSGRLVSPWAVTPAEEAEVAELLDRLADAMHGPGRDPYAPAPLLEPPTATAPARAPGGDEGEESRFGRYLVEMLLTGLVITAVLVAILLVLG